MITGTGVHDPPERADPRIQLHQPHPPAPAFNAKSFLPPEFYSGATGPPGCFSEGFSLRRVHQPTPNVATEPSPSHRSPVAAFQNFEDFLPNAFRIIIDPNRCLDSARRAVVREGHHLNQ